jgi:hypothetical protein
LWLTSVTVEGDSSQFPTTGGVSVAGGQLYAEGAIAACLHTNSLFKNRFS